MFNFKFGRQEASEMHVKDETPRKIHRRLEEMRAMRAKPVLTKDAEGSTRNDTLSKS